MRRLTFTAYKNTPLLALAAFLLLAGSTTTAIAVTHRHDAADAPREAAYLGRFVVTPSATRFVSGPAETRWDERTTDANPKGVL